MTNSEMPAWRRRLLNLTNRIDAFTHRTGKRYRSVTDPLKERHKTIRNRPLTVAIAWLVWAVITIVLWQIVNTPPTPRGVSFCLLASIIVLYLCLLLARGTVKQAEADERAQYENRDWIDQSILPERTLQNLEEHERIMHLSRSHPISIIATMNGLQAGGLVVATISVLSMFIAMVSLTWEAASFGILLALICLMPLAIKIWDWFRNEFYFTETRILRMWGIFEPKEGMCARSRIQNIGSKITLFSRIIAGMRIINLPYGHIKWDTAGQDEAIDRFRFAPQPALAKLLLLPGALKGMSAPAGTASERPHPDGT
ncbi:MAG: hypothetical protein K0S68_422 [Candidatus Saccharibacteria bacterium]|nr:hypothetical protein [Candidatus Saccharibacteria bacterium]